MSVEKVLIITKAFYPDITPRSFRATELARELARQGHEVVVSLPVDGFDYTLIEKKYNIRIHDLGKLKWKNVELKGGRIRLLFRRILKRILQVLFEYPDLELMFRVSKLLRFEKGYDVLISIAVPYPIHWGVAMAWDKKKNIAGTWIADCGDPYMGDRMDSFRKLFYFRYIEKWFCRKTDFITIPVEEARQAYYPEFHSKIRVIPQGLRYQDLDLPAYHRNGSPPVFAYAGNFIPGKRDPRQTLEYMSSLNNEFKFVIFTSHRDLIEPYIKMLGDKLSICNLVPREKLLKILSAMDFLINFDNNTETQVPSKLIDYSITGRPVLNIKGPGDFNILNEFLAGDYTHKMKLNSPDYYNIESVAKMFLSLK